MFALSPMLKKAAMSGKIDALEKVLTECHSTVNPSTFHEALDVIVFNMRKGLHPKATAFRVENTDHASWLRTIIMCFHLLCCGFERLLQGTGGDAVFSALSMKLERAWKRDVWPCMQLVIDHYLLDDSQPALREGDDQQVTFQRITSTLLNISSPEMFDLSSLMDATSGLGPRVGKLLMRYLTKYSSHLHLNVMELAFRLKTPSIAAEMAKDADFFPAALALLKAHRRIAVQNQIIMMEAVAVFGLVVQLAPLDFDGILEMTELYPEFLTVSLKHWDLRLEYWEKKEPRSQSETLTTDIPLPQIICIVDLFLSASDANFKKIALKRGLLSLVLRTCNLFPRADMILESMGDMIDHFLPHLVHYSTLTAICRALDVNDDQAIPMPTAGSKLQLAATRKWNTLRASVANRKKLLEEYRRAAIPSLCGYQQCPKDKLVKFQECSGCEYEQYCSRSCQRADWKRHKAMCNSPAIANLSHRNVRDADFLEFMAAHDLQRYLTEHPGYEAASTSKKLVCDYSGGEYPPPMRIVDLEVLASDIECKEDAFIIEDVELVFKHRQAHVSSDAKLFTHWHAYGESDAALGRHRLKDGSGVLVFSAFTGEADVKAMSSSLI